MKNLKKWLHHEAAPGALLALAVAVAMACENLGFADYYDLILATRTQISIGTFVINKPLLLWINDGLMALFFVMVGLEIKYEVLRGNLASPKQFALPALAASGGIILPALIYFWITRDDAIARQGWAIPAATDIAFALGILLVLGNRVPSGLKVILVATAIIDDLAAIVIIAIFYTDNLSFFALGAGLLAVLMLFALNRAGVKRLSPYLVIGLFLWASVLKSGVHATLAGVALAMFIPLGDTAKAGASPLKRLEHELHPWISFAILPVFAFANGGVSLAGMSWETLQQPITLGIILGLVVGKQLGIFGFVYAGYKLGLCRLPAGITWGQFYGLALVCGVGFTMSLFIGTLAFEDFQSQQAVRLGVLVASLIAGACGFGVLRATSRKPVAA